MGVRKWTKNSILSEARKHETITDWRNSSPNSYAAAKRNGWFKEASRHMVRPVNHNFKWTKEVAIAEAKKYNRKSIWSRASSGSYNASKKHGWFEECTAHMINSRNYGKWTKAAIVKEIKKYKSRYEWQRKSPGSFSAAQRHGLYHEIASYIPKMGGTSKSEKSVQKIVKNIYPNAKTNFKIIVKKPLLGHIYGFELDIYIPELRKGIEFNGTYWHSEEGLKRGRPKWPSESIKNYHKIKREFFKDRGIEYLEIRQSDWNKDPDICIKQCLDFLGDPK